MSVVAVASSKYSDVANRIGGSAVPDGSELLDVHDPSTGAVISRVPLSGADAVDAAVRAAQRALAEWSATPIKDRVQVFFRYRQLLERDLAGLSALITEENGKVAGEAQAEVLKSMELCEFAVSLPQITAGEVLEVSRGVECRVERYPVGVVASITPFNFPNMVANWTIPNALVLGNTMVLKPSELVPLSANRIADLLREAGLPDGELNVVHGGTAAVEAICDHPGIAA
ncbi:MAG: aldehyde dehydrogenase family protein, partial [Longimicrobiales bacterium]